MFWTTISTYQDTPVLGKEASSALYKLKWWQFSGRLAVAQKNDSWSANVDWRHLPGDDAVKLYGLLGQGATLVRVKDNVISIDFGHGKVASSLQAQHYISQQFGLVVPLQALRYWVMGLPDPEGKFKRFGDGFTQYDWVIELEKWKWEGDQQLPHKITVLNKKAKLKLVIDQWVIESAQPK